MSERRFKDILDFSASYNALLRSYDGIDFATVMRGAAQNETWRDTTSDTLWKIFDACGKDINNIVSTSAIDYIQNISDINTANIPALCNMASMLKYEVGSLPSLYDLFPRSLQMMVDVFSIDREYLFGGDSPILSIPMVRKLMETMKVSLIRMVNRDHEEDDALKDIFTEVKENNHRVSASQYREMVKSIFYEYIITILDSEYSSSDRTRIIDNLLYKELQEYTRYDSVPHDTIIDQMISGASRHPLDIATTQGSSIQLDPSIPVSSTATSLAEQVSNMMRELNISISFNPWVVANEISEHGINPNNELTENEKIVVETVLNAHNKERFDYAGGYYRMGEIESRYGYYKECELVKNLKAFCILYSLNTQSVALSTTELNLLDISTREKHEVHALDFYNYVNKDWAYDADARATVEVDEYGLGVPFVDIPQGTVERETPTFIPRIGKTVSPALRELVGYEYDLAYGDFDNRGVALDDSKPDEVIDTVAEKLTQLVFIIHMMRNEMKRQAQFNAMRGTGSLLAHSINDFLLTKYPTDHFDVVPRWSDEKDYEKQINEINETQYSEDEAENVNERVIRLAELQAKIEENMKMFRNFTNVEIIEYMDTTEYFNIHPTGIFTGDETLLKTRYWEMLATSITDRDKLQIGVMSPNEIHDFYRNSMSMGSLHASTQVEDDVEEFLISLYETGAADTYYDKERDEYVHPINDTENEDNLFAYESKADRMLVQNNDELTEKRNKQFLRYSSNENLNDIDRSRNGSGQIIEAFNWKNSTYASVMLHPFMYTFQLWNPLVNIIINAMSSYVTSDLERSLTNKKVFDELYGTYGESKDFWKYNILDFTGYMTRYEHEKHDKTNAAGQTSQLTGYDGMFYPSAIEQFVKAYNVSKKDAEIYQEIQNAVEDSSDAIDSSDAVVEEEDPYADYRSREYKRICDPLFVPLIPYSKGNGVVETKSIFTASRDTFNVKEMYEILASWTTDVEDNDGTTHSAETLEQIIASIYWQVEFVDFGDKTSIEVKDNAKYQTYYGRWYAHLGYSDERCKRIAKQLWYWRDRIVDAATHRYDVCNYNLDLGNNSMFLMDTFNDELCVEPREDKGWAIESLDKSLDSTDEYIERSININQNTTAGRCYSKAERPKELWIRWNAEPIAIPAFDVWWNNDSLAERRFNEADPGSSPLGSAGRFEEFGQIKYKDSTTNDVISDVIERFLSNYVLDGSYSNMTRGNKAPIFYNFQQNADVLVFSTWDKMGDYVLNKNDSRVQSRDGTSDELLLSGYDRTQKCPLHILCKEVQNSKGEYLFERFLDDLYSIDAISTTVEDSFLSAPYIFSQNRGSIIIPLYRVEACEGSAPEDAESMFHQIIHVKLIEIVCQSVVSAAFETNERVLTYEKKQIFINKENLFAGTVLISNNTNVLFSLDGEKLGIAFLGNLPHDSQFTVSKTLSQSCTRYLADSDPVEKIALVRKKFYKVKGETDNAIPDMVDLEFPIPDNTPKATVGVYSDLRIATDDQDKNIWNSFDRNDKFLCVIQYEKGLNVAEWKMQTEDDMTVFSSRLLNLTSDASYIPLFAYQSPHDFERFPEISGTSKLYAATYFNQKDHWAIQLLGLENKMITDLTKVGEDLIVHDETEDVDTYVNPGQIVDAIYRIWEQSELRKDYSGLARLYNPRLDFLSDRTTSWVERWVMNEEGKESFLKRNISIVRCSEARDGEILNEKNWILKTRTVQEVIDDIRKLDENEFMWLPLDDYYTVALTNNGATAMSTSHILVGTQDPYKYSLDPDWATTLRSPAYLLQYGNGIPGVRKAGLRISIRKRTQQDDAMDPDHTLPSVLAAPYVAEIEIKLYKDDDTVRDRETPAISAYMDSVHTVPTKSILLAVSENELEHMMDYHMLVHHKDIFYNVPHNDQDDILRADLPPHVENARYARCPKCGYVYDSEVEGVAFGSVSSQWTCPKCKTAKAKFSYIEDPEHQEKTKKGGRNDLKANKPATSFLDYLYIYEGSTAFKINEQSDKFCTFQWERPIPELDQLLVNFRKNQVDLNCLLPWSTYVVQEHNPKQPHISTVEMKAVLAQDFRGKENADPPCSYLEKLIVDCLDPPAYDVAFWIDSTASMPNERDRLKKQIIELFRFARKYNKNTKFGFVQFKSAGYTFNGEKHVLDFTDNETKIQNYVNKLHAGGSAPNNWGDENLWSATKLATYDILSWRENSKKIVIAISDEAVDNYTPIMGLIWTGKTTNGKALTSVSQFDDAVWTSMNVVNPDDPTKVRNQYNWGQYKVTTDNPYGGSYWFPGYDETKYNAATFQKAFNDKGIQVHYVETEDKSNKGTRQRIDWINTYVYRIQKDLLDGINAGGFTYSIQPEKLADTLSYIFKESLSIPKQWEYDVKPTDTEASVLERLVNSGYAIHQWEGGALTDNGSIIPIDVTKEDFDSIYKIYANYQKIEDPNNPRGYHFNLFFNMQNLFKPPFEYISSVTKQPAPLIPKNSYLWLDGSTPNAGGKLTLYAQMKWLVDDIAVATKLIPLTTYEIHNISDDKPKFFMKRTSSIEEQHEISAPIVIKFEDVWVDAGDVHVDKDYNLTEDLRVVQACSIHYNNNANLEAHQLKKLAFTIVENEVDPQHTPYVDVYATKMYFKYPKSDADRAYPFRFTDAYSSMNKNDGNSWRVEYTYQDEGYTNEDLYLNWIIPAGTNVVKAIEKMGCLVEDTAILCKAVMKDQRTAEVYPIRGHIYIDGFLGGARYLGVEHGKHLNKYGAVLTNVGNELKKYLV